MGVESQRSTEPAEAREMEAAFLPVPGIGVLAHEGQYTLTRPGIMIMPIINMTANDSYV